MSAWIVSGTLESPAVIELTSSIRDVKLLSGLAVLIFFLRPFLTNPLRNWFFILFLLPLYKSGGKPAHIS